MNPRGRRIALAALALGLLTLAGAGWASKDMALERWFLWKLESADARERKHALERLGQVRSARAAPVIIQLIKSNLDDVEPYYDALVNIGPASIPPLVESLSFRDPENIVRSQSINALVEIGSKAVPTLIAIQNDEDLGLHADSSWAIVRIGEDAVPALVQALEDKNRTGRPGIIWALAKIGSGAKEALSPLIGALDDHDKWVRLAATWAVLEIDSNHTRSIHPLIRALSDEEHEIRSGAALSLARIGPEASLATAVLTKIQADQVEVDTVRTAAAAALKKIQGEER